MRFIVSLLLVSAILVLVSAMDKKKAGGHNIVKDRDISTKECYRPQRRPSQPGNGNGNGNGNTNGGGNEGGNGGGNGGGSGGGGDDDDDKEDGSRRRRVYANKG